MPQVWQAIVDRFGPVGTKKAPGQLYGIRQHARDALALAIAVHEGVGREGAW